MAIQNYFRKNLVDADCVGSDSYQSLFRTKVGEMCPVLNHTIHKGAIDPSNMESHGGVKVGTSAKVLRLFYTDGVVVNYVSDPALERKYSPVNYGLEHVCHENKKSSQFCCKKDVEALVDDFPKQYRVLAAEISAMANARAGDFELTIGTTSAGDPVGINKEVNDIVETESQMRNYFSQTLGVNFTAGLSFIWETPKTSDGELLILRIQGKKYQGETPVLLAGTYCYLRSGSNSQRLSGIDLINFIKNF